MGLTLKDKELRPATLMGQGGSVVEDAPMVCPPPERTKERKGSKKASEKRRSRLEALTRPTASSLAKTRNHDSPPAEPVKLVRQNSKPVKTKKSNEESTAESVVHTDEAAKEIEIENNDLEIENKLLETESESTEIPDSVSVDIANNILEHEIESIDGEGSSLDAEDKVTGSQAESIESENKANSESLYVDVENVPNRDLQILQKPEFYPLDVEEGCDGRGCHDEEYPINPLVVDAEDILLDALSDDFSSSASTDSAMMACMACQICPRMEMFNKLFNLSQRVACAVSFAAGLSLGMAIGACTLIHAPQT